MKSIKNILFSLLALSVFISCKTEEPFSGIKVLSSSNYYEPQSTIKLSATYFTEGVADNSTKINVSIAKDTTSGAVFSLTSKAEDITITSGETFSLKLGKNYSSKVKLIFSTDFSSTSYTIFTTTRISKDDSAFSFASLGVDVSKMSKTVTVSNAYDLKSYASKGGYTIFVDGEIDMTDGLLPSSGSFSNSYPEKMDDFVNSASGGSYTTYSAWFNENSNVSTSADTGTSDISNKYKNVVQIKVASNTQIIGLKNAVIRGAVFSIRYVENVVIRNIKIQDSIDPFPHHESGDGFNAQHDAVGIDSSSNVWIDHCTFEDTIKLATAKNGEKWQVFDGLCDMKADSKNITVSFCQFINHDKTMLIGSGDSDGSSETRTITLANNYFLDCGQRCPMVRNSRIHIYNNVFDSKNRIYTSQSTINARSGSIVFEENNYWGSGVASTSVDGGTITSKKSDVIRNSENYEYDLFPSTKKLIENTGYNFPVEN